MPEIHVVNKKDRLNSLWKISKCYGVSFQELKKLNPSFKGRIPQYWVNNGDKVILPQKKTNAQDAGRCIQACPIRYFVRIIVGPATGVTSRGACLDVYRFAGPSELADIGYYLDVEDKADSVMTHEVVPVDGTLRYSAGEQKSVVEVNADKFKNVKNVYIWATPMVAAFFHAGLHGDLAVGRIKLPRSVAVELPVKNHPQTGVSVPKGSRELVFDVGILKSAVRYMLEEIIKNSHSTDIPTSAWGWRDRAQEKRVWDYKWYVNKVWADKIRLGNYGKAVDSGAFSNFHYGYVAAAGGNSRDWTRRFSDWGQVFSSGSWDPPEDTFAVESGFDLFVANNGPITESVEMVELPGDLFAGGMTVPVSTPMHQVIRKDLTRSDFEKFLLEYQNIFDALRDKPAK